MLRSIVVLYSLICAFYSMALDRRGGNRNDFYRNITYVYDERHCFVEFVDKSLEIKGYHKPTGERKTIKGIHDLMGQLWVGESLAHDAEWQSKEEKPGVSQIRVKGIELNRQFEDQIFDALRWRDPLEGLYFTSVRFTSCAIEKLRYALLYTRVLKNLCLDNCGLTTHDAIRLLSVLITRRCASAEWRREIPLECLSMQYNYIDVHAIQGIIEQLPGIQVLVANQKDQSDDEIILDTITDGLRRLTLE